MKRNVASQIVGCQMTTAADGSDFTGTVSCYVTGNGGTQGAGGGSVTHEGNGFHTYTPTQAETNYDHVAFTFKATGAITTTVQVYPSFPQTADAPTAAVIADAVWDEPIAGHLAGGSVGSYAGATLNYLGNVTYGLPAVKTLIDAIDDFLDTEVAAIKAKTDVMPDVAAIADAVWDEAIAGHLASGTAGLYVGTINSVVAAIKAKTDVMPSAADVADAVWDEALSGHAGAGSAGEALTGAGTAGDPWTAPLGGYGAGTAGQIVYDFLDAAVSSVGGGSAPTAAEIADAVWDETIAGHIVVGSTGVNLATACNTVTSGTSGNVALKALIDAVDNFVDTEVAAIKAKTDFLPSVAAGAAGGLFIAGANAATTVNITGTISTVTTLTNLPAITAGWLTAAGIAASALNGKGDWNVGKTGYSLTQGFPSNFSALSITAGGLVDITQAAADKAWGTASRVLTAGTNIVLAKGTGLTGFNDLDAPGMAAAVWNAAITSYGTGGSYGERIETNLDVAVSSVSGGGGGVADWTADQKAAIMAILGIPAAGTTPDDPTTGILDTIRDAVLVVDDLLDTEVAAIKSDTAAIKIKTDNLPADPADASDVATAIAAVGTKIDIVDDLLDTEMPALTGAVAAIKAKTDFLPSATPGAAGGLFIAGTNADSTVNITGNITGNLSGSVGSVAGAVGSVTGHTPQSGDAYARLGAPAGASLSADILGIKTETSSIRTDANDIKARLPVALVGGRLDSNLSAIGNSTSALVAFKQAIKGNVIGTVGLGSTPTSIITSSLIPAGSVADQFKGRLITFSDDTTTAALRGQSTDITASTASATPTLTVTPLTTAAAAGDTFSIT
jgi:hypothetical protein